MDAETLGYTMGDVKTLPLVDTLAHTLAQAKSNSVDNRLVDVEAKALTEKLPVTLLEAER